MPKNKSEMLLEGCLRNHGYADFDFEPEIPGTTRRPDYRLRWADGEVLLEVKEFRGTADNFKPGGGFFDPYPPLREKIEQGRDKFQKMKQHCCCLFLHNVDKLLVFLDWTHFYGAMLGKVGFSVPIHLDGQPPPDDAEIQSVFLSKGQDAQGKRGRGLCPPEPDDQRHHRAGSCSCRRRPVPRSHARPRSTGRGSIRRLDAHGFRLEASRWTLRDPSRKPLRAVVHENPYARIPLPAELFRGPWDERDGGLDGRIQQLFIGDEVVRLPPKE